MAKKKKIAFKSLPNILLRPPKAMKKAVEFAKKNSKKESYKNDSTQSQMKNIITPLVTQLDDGSYITAQSEEKFEDLFQLVANLK